MIFPVATNQVRINVDPIATGAARLGKSPVATACAFCCDRLGAQELAEERERWGARLGSVKDLWWWSDAAFHVFPVDMFGPWTYWYQGGISYHLGISVSSHPSRFFSAHRVRNRILLGVSAKFHPCLGWPLTTKLSVMPLKVRHQPSIEARPKSISFGAGIDSMDEFWYHDYHTKVSLEVIPKK